MAPRWISDRAPRRQRPTEPRPVLQLPLRAPEPPPLAGDADESPAPVERGVAVIDFYL
jgi:hypothetical protein